MGIDGVMFDWPSAGLSIRTDPGIGICMLGMLPGLGVAASPFFARDTELLRRRTSTCVGDISPVSYTHLTLPTKRIV